MNAIRSYISFQSLIRDRLDKWYKKYFVPPYLLHVSLMFHGYLSKNFWDITGAGTYHSDIKKLCGKADVTFMYCKSYFISTKTSKTKKKPLCLRKLVRLSLGHLDIFTVCWNVRITKYKNTKKKYRKTTLLYFWITLVLWYHTESILFKDIMGVSDPITSRPYHLRP